MLRKISKCHGGLSKRSTGSLVPKKWLEGLE